jgi:ribonuclease P protein component
LWNKTTHPLQAGFAVSSSQFKKAVHRNRIKRLCREAYRLQKNPLAETLRTANKSLSVFFIYTGKELPVYDEIYSKMGQVLEEMGKRVDGLRG